MNAVFHNFSLVAQLIGKVPGWISGKFMTVKRLPLTCPRDVPTPR